MRYVNQNKAHLGVFGNISFPNTKESISASGQGTFKAELRLGPYKIAVGASKIAST